VRIENVHELSIIGIVDDVYFLSEKNIKKKKSVRRKTENFGLVDLQIVFSLWLASDCLRAQDVLAKLQIQMLFSSCFASLGRVEFSITAILNRFGCFEVAFSQNITDG